MRMKEKIAKCFCLTTMFLLLFHVSFSFFSFSNNDYSSENKKTLQFSHLEKGSNEFILENELNEEIEDFENFKECFVPSFSFFEIKQVNLKFSLKNKLNYTNYKFSKIVLAKWLEVKHILI